MRPPYDKYFIQRYLSGECSAQERKDFLEWLSGNPQDEQEVYMLKTWREQVRHSEEFSDAKDRILQQILGEIAKENQSANPQVAPVKYIYRKKQNLWERHYFFRYAAIFLLLILSVSIWQQFQPEREPEVKVISMVRKNTIDAQRLTFMLVDGTKITLNSNSILEYPEVFSDSIRQVILTGEAYFEVAEDASRPFTVISGDVSTVAVGTAFNIRYDSLENNTCVSLTQGKVLVHNVEHGKGEFNVYLEPGEELAYNTRTQTFSKEHFDLTEKIAWKDGILYFGGDNVDTIVKKLSTWYGVQIEVKNRPRKAWYFEGSFNNQSLENVLKGMAYAKGFDYSIEDKKVTLTF